MMSWMVGWLVASISRLSAGNGLWRLRAVCGRDSWQLAAGPRVLLLSAPQRPRVGARPWAGESPPLDISSTPTSSELTQHCVFQLSEDKEDEDVLHAVDPNEVFPRAPPPLHSPSCSSSESDSGISEDPVPTASTPEAPPTSSTLYQVVYDLSNVKTEPGDVISIELGENQPIRRLL